MSENSTPFFNSRSDFSVPLRMNLISIRRDDSMSTGSLGQSGIHLFPRAASQTYLTSSKVTKLRSQSNPLRNQYTGTLWGDNIIVIPVNP